MYISSMSIKCQKTVINKLRQSNAWFLNFHRIKHININCTLNNRQLKIILQFVSGPAFESAGPDWKHFRGAPFNGACRNFWGGSL